MNKDILKLSFALGAFILLATSCSSDPNSGIFVDESAKNPSPYASTQASIYTTPISYSLKDTLAKYNAAAKDSTKKM
ncbi:MAG: hypothetical protein IE931_10775 [Sphingobacteriales bacterium]|nr:hypothetical protein [Sphingobacteriales bacterium]